MSGTRIGRHGVRPRLVLGALLLCAPLHAAEWRVASPEAEVVSGVRETVWSLDVGDGDRVGLHRYRGEQTPFATLVYLPGTNMNGALAVPDEDHNLWLFLARRGVDVFALDYRTHALGSGELDDAAVLRDWTMDAFVADALAAVSKARVESASSPLFVAGFSRGVGLAFGVVSGGQAGELAGLVGLDGPFKNLQPEEAYDRKGALESLASSQRWASDVAAGFGWERRARLMEAAAENPDAPALEGDFSSVGEQLAQILYRAWRPGGLANAVHGFSDPAVLGRLMADYDRYYPAVQNVEGASIADHADDPATSIDDDWGELDLPILAFSSSGMGTDWVMGAFYSATASGSQDVTLHLLEGYGHLDVIAGEHARQEVFEPTLEWMRERAKR